MRDTRTVSSHVVTVVRTLRLPRVNRSFMTAAALPTCPVVAPAAVPYVVVGNRQHLALVALNIMKLPARPVDVQPLYHLCLAKTARSIAVNATSHREPHALAAVTTPVATATAIVAVTVVATATV